METAAQSIRPANRSYSRLANPGRSRDPASCQLGFGLFLLLLAILVIRPGDIVVGLEGWPFYEIAIVVCLAASMPAVIRKVTWRSLSSQPAHFCVIGLLPAIVLSHLIHGDTWDARISGLDFAKTLIFYLLLVSLLTTRRRFEIVF